MSFRNFIGSTGLRGTAFHPVPTVHNGLLSIAHKLIGTKLQPSQLIQLRLPASSSGQPGLRSQLSNVPSLDIVRSTPTIQGTVIRATIHRSHAPALAAAVKQWASASGSLAQPIKNDNHVSQEGQTDPSRIHESLDDEAVDCEQEFYSGLGDLLNLSGTGQIEIEMVIDSPALEKTHYMSQVELADESQGGSAGIKEFDGSSTGEEGKNEPDAFAKGTCDQWANDPEMAALFADADIKL